MIKDTGNRREFETGAVRDMASGKGRCDLLPLDVVSVIMAELNEEKDLIIDKIDLFQKYGNESHLIEAIERFGAHYFNGFSDMMLEVSIHFEEGADKYGESNWRRGLPVNCYIDSALRHYFKFLRGDKDERHDRAFVWNLMCCIWTCIHKPELNCYKQKEVE